MTIDTKELFSFPPAQKKALQKIITIAEGAPGAGSVNTAAIQDGAVTTAKLASASVTGAKLGAMTSAQLAGAISDETGSGAAVFATSPALITPALDTPSAGVLTNCTGLPVSTGISGMAAGVAAMLAAPSSANIKTACTDETGSGALVFATSPVLVTPALGTPASGVLTNCTGLPVAGMVGSFSGAQTTRAGVRAEVGDSPAIGSRYFSTAGKMYLKCANGPADTDWQRVTTTAAD